MNHAATLLGIPLESIIWAVGMIYKWRRELQRADSGFTPVIVKADEATVYGRHDVIEVAFGNGTQLRIPSSVPAELAASVVKALVRR